ncbi:hypothetical protein [Methanopyrus sp. SNP6]|uniref:hypothetical protein n=1 Tax=Methanopyrus sp. SNP6 TaxID=1937005 RepID=UPI0011E5E73B|nr:hypothetical protein [Methanopyrus sp. SNP6]
MPIGLTLALTLATVASPVPSPPEIPHETFVIEGVILGIQDDTVIVRCDDEVLRLKVDSNVRVRLSDMIGQRVKLKVVDGVVVSATPLATPTERRQSSGRTVTQSEHLHDGAAATVKERPASAYSTSRSTTTRASPERTVARGGASNTGAGGYGRGTASMITERKSGKTLSGAKGEASSVGGTGTTGSSVKKSAEKVREKTREHPSGSARVMERERPEPVVSSWGSVAALIIAVTLIATVGFYLYRRGLPARTQLYQTHSAT